MGRDQLRYVAIDPVLEYYTYPYSGIVPCLSSPPLLTARHDRHHRRLSRRTLCILVLCLEDLLRGAAGLETVGVTNILLLLRN